MKNENLGEIVIGILKEIGKRIGDHEKMMFREYNSSTMTVNLKFQWRGSIQKPVEALGEPSHHDRVTGPFLESLLILISFGLFFLEQAKSPERARKNLDASGKEG